MGKYKHSGPDRILIEAMEKIEDPVKRAKMREEIYMPYRVERTYNPTPDQIEADLKAWHSSAESAKDVGHGSAQCTMRDPSKPDKVIKGRSVTMRTPKF